MKQSVAVQPTITAGRRAPAILAERVSPLIMQRWPILLLLFAGLLLRLWLISITPLDPRFSNADDGDFYRRALRLAVTGQYIDDAWLIRPPLHVFFFAIWLKLALVAGLPQYGVLFVQIAQAIIGTLTILAGYAVARRLFTSELAGILFGGFLALWFPFVEQPTVLFSELLYLFLFLVHVWLLLRFGQGKHSVGEPGSPTPPSSASEQSGSLTNLALSGLVLGAAALTRSPALYSLAFVLLWLLLRPGATRNWPALIRQGLLVVACCLAVVLPWTARNYLVYERLIPVDTLGQINLWLDLDRVSLRNEHIETLRGMPQADRAGYALEQARAILAEDPLRPFESMWPTFQHIWKAQYVEDFFIKQSFFTRPLRESAALGLFGDIVWFVFTLAGIAGLAARPHEGLHNRLFVLAWLGYSFLTVLIYHVEPRYLLPIWTLIALYGAGFLASLRRPGALPAAKRSWLAPWSVLQLVGVLLFLWLVLSYRNYPAIIANGIARERGYVAGERAYLAGDYPAAERGFREALAAQPGFVDAQVNLALSLAAQGRRDQAIATLKRDSSRRAELVYGALARDAGDLETARATLNRYEQIAGEDVQRWARTWFRPPATSAVTLGGGLDLGYIEGFLEPERDPTSSYRWLAGSGSITLPLPEPLQPGATVALRLVAGRAAGTTLDIQIGDGPRWRVPVVSGQWRVYRFVVPPELVGAQSINIKLQAPTFVPVLLDPASTDARALSLMVSEIRVQ